MTRYCERRVCVCVDMHLYDIKPVKCVLGGCFSFHTCWVGRGGGGDHKLMQTERKVNVNSYLAQRCFVVFRACFSFPVGRQSIVWCDCALFKPLRQSPWLLRRGACVPHRPDARQERRDQESLWQHAGHHRGELVLFGLPSDSVLCFLSSLELRWVFSASKQGSDSRSQCPSWV